MEEDFRSIKLHKLEKLRQKGINSYGQRFIRSHSIADVLQNFQEGQKVVVAGRIMARRSQGKVAFMDLMDQSGRIQLFVKLDVLGQEGFDLLLDCVDIGDVIGAEGETFKTKTGQDSIRLLKFEVLAKSLQTLPEK